MTVAATAVFSLVDRARATARPAEDRLKASLARHERIETTRNAVQPQSTDGWNLDGLRAKSKAARDRANAAEADLHNASERLDGMLVERRRRQASILSRWLKPASDAESEIIELRRSRDALFIRFGSAQDERLRAEEAERTARRAVAVAEAGAAMQAEAARNSATARLAIIGRARRLLARVPVLAYVGVRRLLALAARIEAARERGYDIGPGMPLR